MVWQSGLKAIFCDLVTKFCYIVAKILQDSVLFFDVCNIEMKLNILLIIFKLK